MLLRNNLSKKCSLCLLAIETLDFAKTIVAAQLSYCFSEYYAVWTDLLVSDEENNTHTPGRGPLSLE